LKLSCHYFHFYKFATSYLRDKKHLDYFDVDFTIECINWFAVNEKEQKRFANEHRHQSDSFSADLIYMTIRSRRTISSDADAQGIVYIVYICLGSLHLHCNCRYIHHRSKATITPCDKSSLHFLKISEQKKMTLKIKFSNLKKIFYIILNIDKLFQVICIFDTRIIEIYITYTFLFTYELL